MMDGDPVTDGQVHRAAILSRVCEGFGCLPSAAGHELDNDPDQLALFILDIRGYMAAKHAFDGAVDKASGLKGWIGNPYMTLVQTNTMEKRLGLQEHADGR